MPTETGDNTPRIPPSEAAEKARQFVGELLKGVTDPQVEEVESTDNDRFWSITLGFETRDAISGFSKTRYKVVKIDAQTGEIRSMKIREV